MIKVSFLPKLLIFLVITLISYSSFSEGTKEAMPNSSNGTALQVKYSSGTGSYYNCPADQRIYFHIKDHNTENFYFGLNKRMRSPSTGVPTNVYYRIMNSSGQVVGPTAVPASGNGFISNYTQAIAGPKIGSYNSSGYAPITYNPSANGDYWIEIYRTSSGTTGNATGDNGEVFFIYFDFTVATTANVKKSGRVYSKAWSFITYRPSTLLPDIGYSFEGDYYGYTADSAVNKIEFGAGFQPFGFVLQMNKEGVENTGDFANDRSSKHQGLTAPSIANAYKVFLNEPDISVFPVAQAATQPVITGNIYGCAGGYFIPYYINKPGDVAILLDLNGTAGYQTGTVDRVLEEYGKSAGNHVMNWDGLNGLGATVSTGVSVTITADIYRGRTNIPIYDAEYNINGLAVTSIYPNTGPRLLYWDDTQLTNNGTCGSGNENEVNNTGVGIARTNFYEGVSGSSHPWNGSGPSTVKPAPANGKGNATTITCDDFGNARVINTWFWADNISSTPVSKTIPSCGTSGGLTFLTDLDDDDDGISDLIESGGVDPHADADNDGIPNYLDPSYPGFVDANTDGVNDNFDFDKDGIINSLDLDSDNDGISDIIEAGGTDANNDATVDNYVDLNNNGITDQYDIACNGSTTTNYALSVIASGGSGVVNPNNILGASDNNIAGVTMNSDFITVDMGMVISSGTVITFTWREKSGQSGTALMNVYADLTTNPTSTQTCPTTNSTTLINSTVTLNTDARYIKISKGYNTCGTTSSTDYEVDAISYPLVSCVGGTAIANPDTDSDGKKNFLDLDSDNDGCGDANEAYNNSTAQGTDGNMYYGNGSPPAITASGKVVGATYPGTNAQVLSVGSQSTITTQAVNRSVNEGDNTTFAVVATGGSGTRAYRWQVSTNEGTSWSNISNGSIYTGATTATLTLTNIPYSFNGNDYRVLITQSNYSCAQVLSTARDLDVNGAPTAVNDNNSTNEDVTITVADGSANSLLMNDTDPDNDVLSITQFIVNSQTYTAGQTATIANVGTLRINSGGGYTFIPVANYNGTVPTATYTITDGALTDFATLLITVNAVNDIPIAVNDVNAVYEDASLNVAASGVLSNDTDPEGNTLTVASIRKGGVEGSGTAGTLGAALTGTYGDLTLNTNGSYTYVANNANSLAAGATVTDVFNYTISDGNGGTDIATLTITITGTNDAPIAVNDVNSIYQGVTLKVINGSANDLLNNDSDPDNDPITITQFVVNGVTKSAGQTATISGVGSLKINADGSYTFTPTISFNGTVPTVTYTISDGYSTDNATLIITVIPDSDGDGIADNIDIDDDNDGITDLNESGGVDPLADADSDGTPNYRDQTPGSGLPTWVDTNADGINDKYDADLDGIINSIDLDSDNDGVPDLLEAGGVDTDGDGRIDSTTDTDGDGLMNPYDASTGGDNIVNDDRDGDGVKNYLDLDSDNDGIPDVIESGGTDSNNDGKIDGYTDTDGDGFAQSVDGDSNNDGTAENTANALIITGTDGNNDGVPDSWPRANNDGNGFPNAYDLDADGDGILDAREAGMPDADNNGIADGTLGADGWSNTVDELSSLNLTNTDGHGNPDYLDIDSDNDGIVDNIEAQSTADYIAPSGADNDGDGIDNAYDNNDYTFGGNEDNGLTPVNTDKTDNPDYRDLDTDNDGRDDRLEGWDTDGNGTIEGNEVAYLGLIDLDNDGLFEKYDSNDNLIDPTNGGARPTSYPDVVNVGQDRDWREALSTLPVELYSQEAKLIDQYAVVSWATASETNNDYFVVEKSSDNHSFELVERIGGAGNSNVLIQYQSVDFEPYKGVSYYRITQVDYDGKDETFPTMVINNKHNTQMSFTAFPNPASDQVDILSSEGGMISIYNSTGVNVYQASIEANVKQTINVRDLNPGVYMIQIQHSTGMEIKKLMVK